MRSKDTQIVLHFFFFIMTKQTAIGMLKVAQTGNDLLDILDTLMADLAGYDYAESPMIEKVLGIPTLEPMEF